MLLAIQYKREFVCNKDGFELLYLSLQNNKTVKMVLCYWKHIQNDKG